MQNTKNRIINNSSISNKLSRDQLETQLAQVKDYQQAGIQAPLVISRQIEEIDILNYLSTAKKSPKVYWSNREGDFEIGGIGKSWEIKEDDYNRIPSTLSEISTLTKRISPNPFLKIIGGIAFDPKKHTDNRWRDFSNLWFILPEISIIREGNNYYQIAAAIVQPDDDLEILIEQLTSLLEQDIIINRSNIEDSKSEQFSRTDLPDHSEWNKNINNALKEITDHKFKKVVLARRSNFQFDSTINPFNYLSQLKKINLNCNSFLFQPNSDVTFLGNTPERLFKLKGNHLETDAIAGTIRRGVTDDEDEKLEIELMRSKKDQFEQRFVVEGIKTQLQELCKDIIITDKPELLKLAKIQHLISHISCKLKNEINFGDLLHSLHPTPAAAI